jgi:hypothetical protein
LLDGRSSTSFDRSSLRSIDAFSRRGVFESAGCATRAT